MKLKFQMHSWSRQRLAWSKGKERKKCPHPGQHSDLCGLRNKSCMPNLVRGFRAGPCCGHVSHPADAKTGHEDTDGEVIVVDILVNVEKRESKRMQ
jgi:hypothetical protein